MFFCWVAGMLLACCWVLMRVHEMQEVWSHCCISLKCSPSGGHHNPPVQEVSTMLRFGANPIILLINNAGYTIEVEIHDGPYNRVQVRGGGVCAGGRQGCRGWWIRLFGDLSVTDVTSWVTPATP